MRRRIEGVLVALGVLIGGVAVAQSDPGRSLQALDRGDADGARPGLATAAAESLFQLALAESGEARTQTLQSASTLAGEGSWVAVAARGIVNLDERKLDPAIADLERAVGLRGNDKRLRKLLGDARRAKGDAAGALAAYRAATALDPVYATALVGVGDLLREQGDFGGAFNAYNHSVDEQGNPLAGLLGRAAARLYMGDSQGSIGDLERAASLAPPGPDRARAWMGLFYVHAYLRDLPAGRDRAEQTIAMWQELGRGDLAAATANAIARVMLETGRTDDAETWYEQGGQLADGSSLKPEEKVIWRVRRLHGLARVAAAKRDIRKATSLAEEARVLMDSDPANADHYKWIYPYLIGYIRWQDRKYAEAIDQLQQSETDRAFIAYLLADCYARQRDRAAARSWYEKALADSSGLDAESVIVRPLANAWLARNPAGS